MAPRFREAIRDTSPALMGGKANIVEADETYIGKLKSHRKANACVFKRGMKGVYQHCSEKHLHRYLAEFDFRYSNRAKLGITGAIRADQAIKGIVRKRLM